MITRLLLALLALLLLGVTPGQLAGIRSHYVILIDASKSNPMVDSVDHARRIANDVEHLIGEFSLGDMISIGTFGEYDPAKNLLVEKQVTMKFRPPAAMASVVGMIAGFPEAVSSGTIEAQQMTNIAGALQMMARRVDCSSERVVLLVLTDGKEDSDYGKAPPKSVKPIYSGCALMVMVGVGGDTPAETQTIGELWLDWCGQSGFDRCDYRS